ENEINAFIERRKKYIGSLTIPGIDEQFEITEDKLRDIANKFLLAAIEAANLYIHITAGKGEDNFIAEVSMDEVNDPQTPVDLFFILSALADNNCSVKTIQRRLDKITFTPPKVAANEVAVLMDTTYFGRGFGAMLFKDAYSGKNLYKVYVKTETNQQYADGIGYLLKHNFIIKAIVCDGGRGLLQLFPSIPIQMCQFHQAAIIRRYLTKGCMTNCIFH
ncbi:MAG TPA: hypothetical protein VF540_06665, partial [Segetibacter sp.]